MSDNALACDVSKKPPIPRQLRFCAVLKFFWWTLFPSNPQERSVGGCLFLGATEFATFGRLLERMRQNADGQRVLAGRGDTRAMLRNVSALAAAPPGSLARSCLDFVRDHGLSDLTFLDEYVDALSSARGESDEQLWFRRREAVMHDLRHLLAGYGPDVAGEMCLLSFRFGQTGHPGLPVLIVLAAIHQLARLNPVFAPIREACRRGREASLVDLVEWESRMSEPLETFRQALGLKPPVHYRWPSVARS